VKSARLPFFLTAVSVTFQLLSTSTARLFALRTSVRAIQVLGVEGMPRSNEFYHGTSHEAAQAIEKEGFRLPETPAANGPGVYLASDPEVAKSYGPAVVKVKVTGRIAGSRTSDDAYYYSARQRITKAGYDEDQHEVLKEQGFKGKTDDDGAKVVFDPKHVQFIGHHALGEQFR
jgi:hypothetical protein